MSVFGTVVDIIKRHFLSGVLVVVPLILTYWVLSFLFQAIDGILQPIIHGLIGYYIPGLGIVTTISLIMLAGFFTRNIVGARLYSLGERLLTKVPLIRPIYLSAKQVLAALTKGNKEAFKEVCLIEYPRPGIWVLGFISGSSMADFGGGTRKYVSVFIGSTPTPITGWTVLIPEEELFRVDMSVEDGIKFLVSGGVVAPDTFAPKTSVTTPNAGEYQG